MQELYAIIRVNSFLCYCLNMRTLTQDTVNKVGESVTLMGWVAVRRDHGKLIFIDLRDRWGIVQVVFTPGNKDLLKNADRLRSEWVVEIHGTVKARPKNMENPDLPTGGVEIEAQELHILNEAQTSPFALDTNGYEIGEENRLKYRYLDLRRERPKKNLIMRDKIIAFMRDFLHARDFIEVETPILTKSTPEGARDYVVPSRVSPGKFYALPQSPQQYKQLLMVAGIERYFQVARCFRDEDTRGDRQPEHTQLDIEISFATQEEILSMAENLFTELVETLFPEKRITVKPWPRLTYAQAMAQYGTDKPDLRKNKSDLNELAFAWILDFPLFEYNEEERRIQPTHHMFTMPQSEHIPLLDTEPLKVLGQLYDMVLNGCEISSGSIRIVNPAIQEKIFNIIGISSEEAHKKFGHMLEAFSYGAPPHGGLAPGIDRLVMILQNEPNIREVIAFPKTGDGRDLMMDAPSEIDKKQLKELHLKL